MYITTCETTKLDEEIAREYLVINVSNVKEDEKFIKTFMYSGDKKKDAITIDTRPNVPNGLSSLCEEGDALITVKVKSKCNETEYRHVVIGRCPNSSPNEN